MKFISSQDLNQIVSKTVADNNLKCVGIYKLQRKLYPVVMVVGSIVASALSFFTIKSYTDSLESKADKLRIVVCIALFLIASLFVQVIIHECIHIVSMLIVGKKKTEIYITVGKRTLGVLYNGFLRKWYDVFTRISPVFVLTAVITFLSIIFSNVFLFLWLEFINLLLSSTDIASAITIIKHTPHDAILYSNYYK